HGEVSPNLESIRAQFIEKVKKAARCPVNKTTPPTAPIAEPLPQESWNLCGEDEFYVLIIGSSTGGPSVVELILRLLPQGMPLAIIIAQHMPETFTKMFARQLNAVSNFQVEEAKKYGKIQAGLALVAPGGQHVYLDGSGRVLLKKAPPEEDCLEDANVIMKEAARVFGAKSIGVILSGMGKDGSEGIQAIKNAGGVSIAQDEDSSVVFGMPGEAIKTGKVDFVLSPHKIARQIIETVRSGSLSSGKSKAPGTNR
ncbi:MAG: chemotaxis protein CheB, partial [bacterium]|nr:chemotaxis protein CheB [bacterium]